MSFPIIMHGKEGEQFSTYAYNDPRWALGMQLITADGRKFRFVKNSGTALVVGQVQQAAANIANHVGRSVANTSSTANARAVDILLGNTSTIENEYAHGYLVTGVDPGGGYAYLISDHLAVAVCGTQGLNLHSGHAVQVALTTVSTASLIHNPYRNVIVYPVTATQVPVGVSVKPITSSAYGWLQTRGNAAVTTAGTVVIGENVITSSATAGSVAPSLATCATIQYRFVGWVSRVGATTTFSVISLNIIDG